MHHRDIKCKPAFQACQPLNNNPDVARTLLYEGKAKILYTTDDPEILLSHFKDDATAFNAQKRGSIAGGGD